MDQIVQTIEPVRQFAKDSIRLVKRCTKPDKKGRFYRLHLVLERTRKFRTPNNPKFGKPNSELSEPKVQFHEPNPNFYRADLKMRAKQASELYYTYCEARRI